MKLFKGLIFDIDGTLTSTNKLIFETFRFVSKKYLDTDLSDLEISKYWGPTEEEIIRELMKDDFKAAMNDYYDYYSSNHKELVGEVEGIKDLLDFIKSKNLPLSIYTGKGRRTTEITLQKTDLLKYFDKIVSGDDVKRGKPSPEGILAFLEEYNLSRDTVLMIGDAPDDVRAARNAGIAVASVLWDSFAKETVIGMKSDFYFHTVKELHHFLQARI